RPSSSAQPPSSGAYCRGAKVSCDAPRPCDGRNSMSIDQARVGGHIAPQMEAIERDDGDDCQIGDICTVVEVLGPHGSHVRVRPSDARPHVGVGLLRWAEMTLLQMGGPQVMGGPDEEEGGEE